MCGNQVPPMHGDICRADCAAFVKKMNGTDISVMDMLNNTNPDAKEEFLAEQGLVRPRNVYGRLDIRRVEQNMGTILSLKRELELSELPEKVKMWEELILEGSLKKNQFVYACYVYNHSAPDEREEAARAHQRANIALYGEPDEAVFWSVLGEKLAAVPVEKLSGEDKIMYGELLALIGPLHIQKRKLFRPKQETIERFSSMAGQFYAGFLSHIPQGQQEFSADEACAITNEIIAAEFGADGEAGICTGMAAEADAAIGMDLSGWRAVVIPTGAAASTDCEHKEIRFPGKRSRGPYTRAELKAIIIHELGVHALRSLPYESCEVKAFYQGLPGCEAFEEGIAKAAEQAVNCQYEDSGFLHYISIGLAVFLGKNFREVFEIQSRLEHLTGGEPAGRCFDSVQRTFRGTGELPNHKDLIYYNGAHQVWKYIEEHLDDAGLMDQLLLSGKTNILDIMHERMVYEICVGGYFQAYSTILKYS